MDGKTGHQQTEERIEHLNAVLRAIRNVNQLIVLEKNTDRLLQQACEKLIETRGYYNAWIVMIDESQQLVATAESGVGDDFSSLKDLIESGALPFCGREAMTQLDVVTVHDPPTLCTDCPLADKYSGRRAMSVCLEHEGHIYGLLTVSIPVAFCDDEEEQSLLKEVAGDLGFALYSMAIEKALKENERRLSTLMSNLPGMAYRCLNDEDWTMEIVSEGCREITGYGPEDLQWNAMVSYGNLILPEDRTRVLNQVQQALSEDRHFQVTYQIQTASNQIKCVWEQGQGILDENGETIAIEGFITDISERVQTEQLRKRFASIVESSDDAIIGKTLDGTITSWNTGAERLYGYISPEAIGSHISILVPPNYPDDVTDILKKVRQGERVGRHETVRARKDGILVDVSLTVSPIKDNAGNIAGVSTIARDITERKRSQKTLEESEGKYRSLFENSTDGIVLRDLAGNITVANQAMSNFTGYDINELQSMNINQLLGKKSFKIVMDMQQSLLENNYEKSSARYELKLKDKKGTVRIIEAITSLLYTEGQEPIVQALLRDVTEQRLAENQIRAYASQVTQAQEEERKRIARELHDETVQDLANLGMKIDTLIDAHRGLRPDEINQHLEEVRNKIDGLLKEVRRVTQDLRPPMLDELGLIFALQWLGDDVGIQSGIEISLEVIGDERRFSQWIEMLLFRIAQEALNNVRKHSGANKAVVRLEFNAEKTRLKIIDDGQGFELPNLLTKEAAYFGKLGLVGMRERASLFQGKLTIESQKGQGTTITVEFIEQS